MNRQQKRAVAARARKQQTIQSKSELWAGVVPDDIKRDIAKVVRSVDWEIISAGVNGGQCYWRNFPGLATLWLLDIDAKLALGGMIYRAGPDERRDVVAFCGVADGGIKTPFGISAHYFLVNGDNIVDFSVGDWKEDSVEAPDHERAAGLEVLPPAQWSVTPPDFFWDKRSVFTSPPGGHTPPIGCAWYGGFNDAGGAPNLDALYEETWPQLPAPGLIEQNDGQADGVCSIWWRLKS